MISMVFLLLCVLVAVAAYLVVRSFFRSRMSFGELMSRIRPAPSHPVMPGTWGQVSELLRVHRNSALFTEAADRYRRIIPACTDEEEAEELTVTHRIFLSNHQKLTSALMVALACFCFGKITKERCRVYVANVTRYYAKEILLLEEMSEVMDESCVSVLKGQFLHGT